MTRILLYDIGPSTTVDSTNVVSNCQFIKLSRPYSDFQYVNAATAPNVINNFAQGVDELWYIEPGSQSSGNQINYPGITAQVTGNTLVDSGYVARILMHSNGTYAGNLNVQNNTVGMMQNPLAFFGPRGPGGVEIETFDSGDSSVGNVTVQNNTFTASPAPWTANPRLVIATSTSPSLFHVNSLTVINNQMIGFPGDGSELEVNKAQIGTYTNTGNTFGSAVRQGGHRGEAAAKVRLLRSNHAASTYTCTRCFPAVRDTLLKFRVFQDEAVSHGPVRGTVTLGITVFPSMVT